jgi:hypothetical protein
MVGRKIMADLHVSNSSECCFIWNKPTIKGSFTRAKPASEHSVQESCRDQITEQNDKLVIGIDAMAGDSDKVFHSSVDDEGKRLSEGLRAR